MSNEFAEVCGVCNEVVESDNRFKKNCRESFLDFLSDMIQKYGMEIIDELK